MRPSKIPVIDLRECSYCESCVSLCPSVFKIHEETGIMEAAVLEDYPEQDIQAAISCCPQNCISWESTA
ncbi:MAG: ferredoxin [Desulfatiglandaceae bacterium]